MLLDSIMYVPRMRRYQAMGRLAGAGSAPVGSVAAKKAAEEAAEEAVEEAEDAMQTQRRRLCVCVSRGPCRLKIRAVMPFEEAR